MDLAEACEILADRPDWSMTEDDVAIRTVLDRLDAMERRARQVEGGHYLMDVANVPTPALRALAERWATGGDPDDVVSTTRGTLVGLAAEVESLRAAVERIRELCTQPWPSPFPGLCVYVADVLRALDGET